ncbi:MAG TPA: hypothetical protein PKE37_09510 [Thiomonas arsenitoxydans]|uniref:hypothetical protein n=1 Tax=Thiomonas TaxID=32012 RepID=UPI002579F28B|nr:MULTISPECIES: hypothetical protein [Thiomonas]HML81988.1 hypothetical protein [Thiomonas arsenitoxydans]
MAVQGGVDKFIGCSLSPAAWVSAADHAFSHKAVQDSAGLVWAQAGQPREARHRRSRRCLALGRAPGQSEENQAV